MMEALRLIGRCIRDFPKELKRQQESYAVTLAARGTGATIADKQEAVAILKGLRR